jgi:hypothetical protein
MTNILSAFNWMENISDIRRNNLEFLRSIAENHFRSKNNDDVKYTNQHFASYIGLSPSFYSQLKNPKLKPTFSESVARKIEMTVSLPKGWLDKDHDTVEFDDVYLDGNQVLSLLHVYREFLFLDGLSIDHKTPEGIEKLDQCLQKVILNTSKFQSSSIDDFVNAYLNKK